METQGIEVQPADDLAGEQLRYYLSGMFVGMLLTVGTLEIEPHTDGLGFLPSFAVHNPRTGAHQVVNVDRFG